MAADPNPVPVPDEKLVRVFDAEQESEVLVVRGLLESQGIDCQMTALDIPQDVMPIGGAVILVRQEDAAQARQLIDDYRRAPGDESDLNSSEASKENLPREK
jgi:Putative prokaryotic signal transducing protein